ncbi:MAG: hypothetical protein WCP07_00225 [bacterium]|jgi:hypothetical protein
MRLQINKRLYSLGDKYDITNESNNLIYQAQGHLFTLGNRLDLFDGVGQLVVTIQ